MPHIAQEPKTIKEELTMRTICVVAAAGVLTLALATSVVSQPPDAELKPPPGGQMIRPERQPIAPTVFSAPLCPVHVLRLPSRGLAYQMKVQLGLTDEQNPKVEALVDKASEKTKTLIEQATKANGELIKVIADPKVEKAAIEKAVTTAAKAQEAIMNAQAAFWLDVKALLTTEQNQKLKEMLEKFGTPAIPRTPPVASPGGARSRQPGVEPGPISPPGGPPPVRPPDGRPPQGGPAEPPPPGDPNLKPAPHGPPPGGHPPAPGGQPAPPPPDGQPAPPPAG